MKRYFTIAFLLFILTGSCLFIGCTSQQTEEPVVSEGLLVYCGAGMREPMDEIALIFEEKEGIPVRYTYGGSAQLLSQIELYQKGDAYMPGALSYIETAMEKGYVDKTEDLVYHIIAIAVPKGNPAGIQGLNDFTKEGLKIVLGDPEGPAIGKSSKKVLDDTKLWDAVSQNVIAYSGTVNELLVYISMNQADATLIWEDLYNSETMDLVSIPKDQNKKGIMVVPIGTLTFSEHPADAEKFIAFVASDEGKSVFAKHGFTIYPDPKYE